MTKTRALVTLAAVTVASFLIAACGGDDAEDTSAPAADAKELFVVSPYLSAQPATKEVVDAFVADAAEAGYKVNTPIDTKNDFAKLNTEMQNAVSQGVDAIVLGMGDPKEMSAGLNAAKDANIPVFGLDAGSLDGVTANITSDNTFLGETSAQAMIDRIGEGGKVIMVHFDPFEPVRLRAEAAKRLFDEKGIQVLEYVQGDPADSTNFAKNTMKDLLAKYPAGAVNGIWAAWDASALGAYQATQETGRTDVFVTGVDGQDFARAEVAKGGNWIATVRQDWQGIADKAVETIDKYFDSQAIENQTIVVPGQLITKDNAG